MLLFLINLQLSIHMEDSKKITKHFEFVKRQVIESKLQHNVELLYGYYLQTFMFAFKSKLGYLNFYYVWN